MGGRGQEAFLHAAALSGMSERQGVAEIPATGSGSSISLLDAGQDEPGGAQVWLSCHPGEGMEK